MSEISITKIAVPMAGQQFSAHYGQTTAFAVFEVDQAHRKIVSQTILPLPGEHACGMAGVLKDMSVQAVIVEGLGRGALANLSAAKLKVYAAIPGTTPELLVQACLDGRLQEATASCGHGQEQGHGHHHQHQHQHGQHHGQGHQGACQCKAGAAAK